MKAQWLDRALFVSNYHYTLCTTQGMFKRELRELALPPADWPPFLKNGRANATVHYLEHTSGRRCALVCIPPSEHRDPLEVLGLLTHEAVHIWQAIREDIGEKEPSAEFEAYAIQRLSQELWGEYRRQVYGDAA
ncbi:hypothetical protein J7E70_02120 [Variovorax paradoxus]|nr:hypothetical protein [Variovorax paradoxus]MBT2299250.1 hypothetical protein [Variovorax paradoxus]